MAKVFKVGGEEITTDEDWYEINAFGGRTGRRFFNGQPGNGPDPQTTQTGGGAMPGGGGAPPLGPPPPSASPTSSLGGLEAAMDGGAMGGGSEQVEIPVPLSIKALGRRIMPNEGVALSGRKVY